MNDNIKRQLEPQGILVATIDMPGKTMNVFSDDLMDALEDLLDEAAHRPDVRAVVLASGKSGFLAGADLSMVRAFTERARLDSDQALRELCGRLSRLFRRLETLGKPFVAAVHGVALGGGLELALACHERVASNEAATQLGLPEVKLGLLPGAGGTQRLPRLIGAEPALEMMLRGDPVSADRALALGIVDFLVARNELLATALTRSRVLAEQEVSISRWDRPGWRVQTDRAANARAGADAAKLGVDPGQFMDYPAYRAIVSCVTGGLSLAIDEGLRCEMDRFIELIRDPVAGNMVRALFLDRQRAAKTVGRPAAAPGSVAALGPRADAVQRVFAPLGVNVPAAAHEGDAVLLTEPMRRAGRSAVAWLRDGAASLIDFDVPVGVWVSDMGPYGRVVEISTRKNAAVRPALAFDLVGWLRAVPLLTHETSLLQALDHASKHCNGLAAEDRHLALALAAARVWSTGAVADTGIADSAAVIAGFMPPYTGGPFTYLHHQGLERVTSRTHDLAESQSSLFFAVEGWNELFPAGIRH